MNPARGRISSLVVTMGLVASASVIAFDPASWSALDSPASAATPSPSASPDRFEITVDELTPKVVHPDDTVTLRGTMRNLSGETLTSVTYALRLSTLRITTRYELAKDADPNTQFGVVLASTRQSAGDDGVVAPGAQVAWQLSLPIDRVSMPTASDDFGAFPIAVEVSSRGDNGVNQSRISTTLLWMPTDAHFTPTSISWLWPVIDGVHRDIGDVFRDDSLANDLAPTGRLGGMVSAAAQSQVPLTYVVDPALVDDATLMATPTPASTPGKTSASPSPSTDAGNDEDGSDGDKSAASTNPSQHSPRTPPPTATETASSTSSPPKSTPYQVDDGNHTIAGTGTAVAKAWLAQLRTAVTSSGNALVATPYADTDLVALARAGLDKEIAIARATGQSMLRTELAPPTLPDVIWPTGGVIDENTLDELATDLVGAVVLNGQSLPPRDANQLASPRTDLQTPSGVVRAVLTDPVLDELINHPESIAGGTRVAEQRFLAETLLVTEQRPGAGSSLVVAPARDAAATDFLTSVLSDSAHVPWLNAVNLAAILEQPADGVPRQPLNYPTSAHNSELPEQLLSTVTPLRAGLSSLNSMLGPTTSDPFISQANNALLRAESSSWRTHPQGALAITDVVGKQLQSRLNKVFISKPGLITLTSRKQKIPLTVVNELPEPVTVQVSLRAVNSARLKVTPIQPFTVEGKGNRHEVVVEVEATTGGRFEVEAQLTTIDGRSVGSPVSFEMNSTAYGAVALAIAGGAAGLLFVLSGIRIYRRVRRRAPTP